MSDRLADEYVLKQIAAPSFEFGAVKTKIVRKLANFYNQPSETLKIILSHQGKINDEFVVFVLRKEAVSKALFFAAKWR